MEQVYNSMPFFWDDKQKQEASKFLDEMTQDFSKQDFLDMMTSYFTTKSWQAIVTYSRELSAEEES